MKLYLICGKASSGKDTLAEYMKASYLENGKRVCILKITDFLNNLLKDYFGWDGSSDAKPRRLMQTIGYDIIQNKLNKKTFLVDILTTKIDVLEAYFDVGIITDGRLIKEIELLKTRYPSIITIYIKRDNFDNGLEETLKKHITEVDLDKYNGFDKMIANNYSLDDLCEVAKKIVGEDIESE